MTAYHAGELTPEEDIRLQDHLLVCKHCTELLLDLEEFLRPVESAATADFQAAASWRKLKEELPTSGPREQVQHAATTEYRLVKQGWVLAALLGTIVIGQLFYQIHLNRELGRFQAFPEQTLDLIEKRGVPEGEPEIVHLPVSLSFQAGEEHARYKVDFLKENGLRYSADLALSQPATGFSVPLTRQLSSGVYEVHVYGWKNGRADAIGSPLKIRIQP